jgi:hypothetical protein
VTLGNQVIRNVEEEGVTQGVSVCFDDWANGNNDHGVQIFYDGVAIYENVGYDNWQDVVSLFEDNAWHNVKVTITPTEDCVGATVALNFDNGAFEAEGAIGSYSLPDDLYLGFTGRTGGANNNHNVRGVAAQSYPVFYGPVDFDVPGKYFLTYTSTDLADLTTECQQEILVVPAEIPTCEFPTGTRECSHEVEYETCSNMNFNINSDCPTASHTWAGILVELGDLALDGGIHTSMDVSTIDYTTPGVHTIDYWVVDTLGQECPRITRTITITDNRPPQITFTNEGQWLMEKDYAFWDADLVQVPSESAFRLRGESFEPLGDLFLGPGDSIIDEMWDPSEDADCDCELSNHAVSVEAFSFEQFEDFRPAPPTAPTLTHTHTRYCGPDLLEGPSSRSYINCDRTYIMDSEHGAPGFLSSSHVTEGMSLYMIQDVHKPKGWTWDSNNPPYFTLNVPAGTTATVFLLAPTKVRSYPTRDIDPNVIDPAGGWENTGDSYGPWRELFTKTVAGGSSYVLHHPSARTIGWNYIYVVGITAGGRRLDELGVLHPNRIEPRLPLEFYSDEFVYNCGTNDADDAAARSSGLWYENWEPSSSGFSDSGIPTVWVISP